MVAQEEFSYRIREATNDDVAAIRQISGTTLSHPEGKGRRESYGSAAQRGELLLLERYDTRAKDWRVCAFVDWHMRVDDILTIRDIGTEGDRANSGMVKQLVMELTRSLNPIEIVLKVRKDADTWNEVIQSIAGFMLEGSEYRRPYWINIWKWSRESAALAARAIRTPRFRR